MQAGDADTLATGPPLPPGLAPNFVAAFAPGGDGAGGGTALVSYYFGERAGGRRASVPVRAPDGVRTRRGRKRRCYRPPPPDTWTPLRAQRTAT